MFGAEMTLSVLSLVFSYFHHSFFPLFTLFSSSSLFLFFPFALLHSLTRSLSLCLTPFSSIFPFLFSNFQSSKANELFSWFFPSLFLLLLIYLLSPFRLSVSQNVPLSIFFFFFLFPVFLARRRSKTIDLALTSMAEASPVSQSLSLLSSLSLSLSWSTNEFNSFSLPFHPSFHPSILLSPSPFHSHSFRCGERERERERGEREKEENV